MQRVTRIVSLIRHKVGTRKIADDHPQRGVDLGERVYFEDPTWGLDGIAALALTRAFTLESQNASDSDSLPGVTIVIFSLKICCAKLDFQV